MATYLKKGTRPTNSVGFYLATKTPVAGTGARRWDSSGYQSVRFCLARHRFWRSVLVIGLVPMGGLPVGLPLNRLPQFLQR